MALVERMFEIYGEAFAFEEGIRYCNDPAIHGVLLDQRAEDPDLYVVSFWDDNAPHRALCHECCEAFEVDGREQAPTRCINCGSEQINVM